MEPPYVPTCPETITEAWLRKVLAREFGVRATPNNAELPIVTDFTISPSAVLTDGFMSRLERLVVRAKKAGSANNDGRGDDCPAEPTDEREFHLVAKLYPPGIFHRKLVSKSFVFE
jgi:hypothetical protein